MSEDFFTVRCKATFRSFDNDTEISRFKESIEALPFVSAEKVRFRQNCQIDTSTDDPKQEHEFVITMQDLKSSIREDHFIGIVKALKETSAVFDKVVDDMVHHGNVPELASVSISLVGNEVFPKKFQLKSVCSIDGIRLGSLMERTKFVPTTYIRTPVDEHTELMSDFMVHSKDEEGVMWPMIAIFEHDREVMNILFPDVYTAHGREGSKRMERVVELQTKYNCIRRCVITFGKDDSGDGFFASVILQLATPMVVYVYQINERDPNNEGKFRTFGNRYLTWNKSADYKELLAHASCVDVKCLFAYGRDFLDFVGRLQKIMHKQIEFRTFKMEEIVPLRNYRKMSLDDFPEFQYSNHFKLAFAIEALVSRGGTIYDYFFHPKYGQFEEFVKVVLERYWIDVTRVQDPVIEMPRTLAALEEMLNRLDHNLDVPPPMILFEEIYKDENLSLTSNLSKELLSEGYMRVRRLIITPTRKIYTNPELVMGNRSLRKLDPDFMLRITFRDDNNRRMAGLPRAIINDTVKDVLTKPLLVGCQKYSYLGSSNSQLRDHGCYFIRGTDDDAGKFRAICGKFDNLSVSKMMARMGQVFTQSRQMSIKLQSSEYSDIFDYEGGRDSNNKCYTFSDGVGQISGDFCKQIVTDLKYGGGVPSCYQIRFRGYKGVLCHFKDIDDTREWAKKSRIEDIEGCGKLPWYDQSILFRMSQKKFKAPVDQLIEIVKVSTPINVNLNKPLINIMDQVSEMQGPDVHRTMKNRICELLEFHIKRNITSLVDEVIARSILNELLKLIHYELLSQVYVTEEPFFRSLLRSTTEVQLRKLKDKMQIRIPRDLGRMMFGVVDETGLLQYGQVFFQYTVNADLKFPYQTAEKKIHTGPVMITKNPSIVPGDYRRFTAVNLRALHHLVDVLVFPQSGPRPHPDEMAGSDLDGDEYSIIWDPKLFLNKNMPAFDFTSPPQKGVPVDPNDTEVTKKMAEFFVNYINQDTIGTIATAHLANADLYGIDSEVCRAIAKKHNQAVDFPKTGIIPDELTKKWGSKGEPPERVERFPHFMPRFDSACYTSTRLLGVLHSRVTELAEMVGFESLVSHSESIVVDKTFLVLGFEELVVEAEKDYHEYSYLLENLMNTYGIKNEGELFSGHYSSLRLKVSDRDNDDMSLFTTSHMIEEQLKNIYGKFRSQFFDEFHGIESCSEIDHRLDYYGVNEVFRRIVVEPTERMLQKASAYYYVAYEKQKCLSFGWLVSDIMAKIRREFVVNTRKFSYSPLADNLNVRIMEFSAANSDYEYFFAEIEKCIKLGESTDEVERSVAEACLDYLGFGELLFYIRKWADMLDIAEKRVPRRELDVLVYLFGIGSLNDEKGSWLHPHTLDSSGEVDLCVQQGGLGKRFLDFLQYLMSYAFSNQMEMFIPLTKHTWTRKAILDISTAAHQTFYPIALNRRFECIPGRGLATESKSRDVEGNNFLFEIPKHADFNYEEMLKTVAHRCGVTRIAYRTKPERFNSQVIVISAQPVGKFQAIQRFRKLLAVEPSGDMTNLKSRATDITEQVLKKLQYYSQEFVAIDDPWPPNKEFFNHKLETFKIKKIRESKTNIQGGDVPNPVDVPEYEQKGFCDAAW